MTDNDKALMMRVSLLGDGNAWPSTIELINDLADHIQAQAAEIETMVPRDVAETWKAKAENLSAALKATAVSNAECLKTVAGLKEEIERLRELIKVTGDHWLALQHKHPIQWEGAIDGAMAAACAEIERLREAGNDLGFYAGHEDACDCVKGWAKGPCNCGYTEAWQAWHNLAGKAEQ